MSLQIKQNKIPLVECSARNNNKAVEENINRCCSYTLDCLIKKVSLSFPCILETDDIYHHVVLWGAENICIQMETSLVYALDRL